MLWFPWSPCSGSHPAWEARSRPTPRTETMTGIQDQQMTMTMMTTTMTMMMMKMEMELKGRHLTLHWIHGWAWVWGKSHKITHSGKPKFLHTLRCCLVMLILANFEPVRNLLTIHVTLGFLTVLVSHKISTFEQWNIFNTLLSNWDTILQTCSSHECLHCTLYIHLFSINIVKNLRC